MEVEAEQDGSSRGFCTKYLHWEVEEEMRKGVVKDDRCII